MRRIQKILEAASHPKTPPAEALAALALFRGLIDHEGGVAVLFERPHASEDAGAAIAGANSGGEGLLGRRGAQRRVAAEVEELRRQLKHSRMEADNLRNYAQRGFSAEQNIRGLEAALAAARAEMAALRSTMPAEPTPPAPADEPKKTAGRKTPPPVQASVGETSQTERELEEAREKIVQLTSAGADYVHRLRDAERELDSTRDAMRHVEQERDAIRQAMAEREQADDDRGRRLRDADEALAQSLADLRLAERERDEARQMLARRDQADEDHIRRLHDGDEALARSLADLKLAERERDEARQMLARRDQADEDHIRQLHDGSEELARNALALRLAQQQCDEAHRRIADLSRAAEGYAVRIGELENALAERHAEAGRVGQERDGAHRRIAELSDAGEKHLHRLRETDDALAESRAALRIAVEAGEKTRQRLADAEAELQRSAAEKAAQDARLHDIEIFGARQREDLALYRARNEEALQRIRQIEADEADHIAQIRELTAEIARIEQMHSDETARHSRQVADLEARFEHAREEAATYAASLRGERDFLRAEQRTMQMRIEQLAADLAVAGAERDAAMAAPGKTIDRALQPGQAPPGPGSAATEAATDAITIDESDPKAEALEKRRSPLRAPAIEPPSPWARAEPAARAATPSGPEQPPALPPEPRWSGLRPLG